MPLKMVHRAKLPHIGSALSISDILAVLYDEKLHFELSNHDAASRDRFIQSKEHACVAVYSALAEVGLVQESQLDTYGDNFS